MCPNLLKLLLIVPFLWSACSDQSPAQKRWDKVFGADEKDNEESSEESAKQEFVPFVAQDGRSIISRHSLGFKRSDKIEGKKFRLNVKTFLNDKIVKEVAGTYMSLSQKEKGNCLNRVRAEKEFVFYNLDCVKNESSTDSRFFDLWFSEDNLLTYSDSECVFEDRGQEEKMEYLNSRAFKVSCSNQDLSEVGAQFLEIEAWYHPGSPHPSGLVFFYVSKCSKKGCKDYREFRVDIVDDDWEINLPDSFKDSCEYKVDLENRVLRCESKSCFDLSLVGYSESSPCKCIRNNKNVPVKHFYVPAQSVSANWNQESELTNYDSAEECQEALSNDESCQSCLAY